MSECSLTDAAMWAKAKTLGLEIHYPQDDELFIDIDCPESLESFRVRAEALKEILEIDWYVTRPSKTPGHFHAVVRLKRDGIGALERVALQAILGSDPVHEALSLKAALAGMEHPTVFFEKF